MKSPFYSQGAKATKISNLSPRELEILRLMAAGWTIAEIAKQFDLSWKTVSNHRGELKDKLGARSTDGSYAHRARREALMLWTCLGKVGELLLKERGAFHGQAAATVREGI